ncbi:hypothetical protein [Microbacterium sp. JB110]|uniref:hypothetical protein n=1 Tax=Microbacterium sp. JB110 TaxID=2024477 RepID=UPI001BB034DD|nr:hypothetical protein [Microbacterium sp. JB110]
MVQDIGERQAHHLGPARLGASLGDPIDEHGREKEGREAGGEAREEYHILPDRYGHADPDDRGH